MNLCFQACMVNGGACNIGTKQFRKGLILWTATQDRHNPQTLTITIPWDWRFCTKISWRGVVTSEIVHGIPLWLVTCRWADGGLWTRWMRVGLLVRYVPERCRMGPRVLVSRRRWCGCARCWVFACLGLSMEVLVLGGGHTFVYHSNRQCSRLFSGPSASQIT